MSDIAARIEATHPLQYGWRGDEIIYHTEHATGDHIRERMNRCHICEQWSPCDARKAADEIERLRELVDELDDAHFHERGLYAHEQRQRPWHAGPPKCDCHHCRASLAAS
jgi:hypothetical protein